MTYGSFRRYPKSTKRQLVDYNRFASFTGEKQLICLDRGIIEICRYFLNSRAGWLTTFYTNLADDGYTIPTMAEWAILENAITEANIDMSGCNEIVLELARIATALENQECCGPNSGSRGSGTTEEAPNPYDQESTPSTPPSGFASMSEFDEHKCNQAEDILNDLKSDLLGLSGVVYAGQAPTGIVSTLIVFMLTPVPFDDLVGLAAYLIYSAFSYSFLAEMSAVIGDNQNDLRCTLYNSPTASDASFNLFSALEVLALDHFTLESDADWVMGGVDYMLTNDSMNRLFENAPTTATGTTCDCDVCGTIADFTFDTTTDGWAKVAANCLGNPEVGTTTLSWIPSNHIRLQATAGSGDRFICVQSPLIGEAVSAESQIQITGNNNLATTNFVRISLQFATAGCFHLLDSDFNSTTEVTRTASIGAFAGDTLNRIEILVGNSIGFNVDLNINRVVVNCA